MSSPVSLKFCVEASVRDYGAEFEMTARFDDFSDDSIVFPTVEEAAVLRLIERMKKIDVASLKFALKKEGDNYDYVFTFPRGWDDLGQEAPWQSNKRKIGRVSPSQNPNI